MHALPTRTSYTMWTPPSSSLPQSSSASSSPSEFFTSESNLSDSGPDLHLHNKSARPSTITVRNVSVLKDIPFSELSHSGDEARFVIFHTDDRRWKFPLQTFFEKSPVLREFIARPFKNSELFDHSLDNSGMQLIRLMKVESVEAEEFFGALYYADAFEPPPSRTSLQTILSVLKLSNLYDVHFLRKRALAHLSLAYPTSLEHWDTRHLRSTFPLKGCDEVGFTYFATPAEILKIIRIAKDSEALWILPSAFYECCQFDMKTLIMHDMFSDGTIDLDVQTKILVGATEQVELSMKEILTFLRLPSSLTEKNGCKTVRKCADARLGALETALGWVLRWPLELWGEDSWDDEQTMVMCMGCRRLCSQMLRDGRKAAWKKLPEIFGMPGWGSLEEQKAATL